MSFEAIGERRPTQGFNPSNANDRKWSRGATSNSHPLRGFYDPKEDVPGVVIHRTEVPRPRTKT